MAESFAFPDPMETPKKKGEKNYGLQYGKALMHNVSTSGVKMFYNDRIEIRKRIAYFMGLNPIKPFQQRLDCWSEENPDEETFMNLNWNVLNLAHRFINVIVGKIHKVEYDAVCTPLDKFAIDKREEKKATMLAYQEEQGFINKLGVPMGKESLGFDPGNMPQTPEELDMHFEMNEKDEMAMEAEMAIELVKQNNDFSQIRKEYLVDIATSGICAVEEKNDLAGKTKMKRIHPATVIVGNSKSEDYKDISHAGYVENITFSELRKEAGTSFNEEEYRDIYEKHCKKNQTTASPINDSYLNPSDEKTVTVFRFYFKSYNQYTYEKKKNSKGNPVLYPTRPNRGKSDEYQEKYAGQREIIEDGYEVVYKGTMIVGSEYIYDYGLLDDMEVSRNNYNETRIPIHIFAPNMMDGNVVSILGNCIPIFDEININWLQFQHSISKYIPDGQAIDLDSLVEAPLGKGGKNLKGKEVLNLYFKTGTYVYKGSKLNGQNGNAKPITPISNSNIEKASRFLDHIFTLIQVLNHITGLNDNTNGSTPSSEALVGVAKFAAIGTDDALQYITHADRMMNQHLSESAVKLTQNAVKKGKVEGIIKALGSDTARFWTVNKNLALCDIGVGVQVRPTEQEWADLYADMNKAVAAGALEFEDKIAIMEIKNLKQARRYMSTRQKELKKQAAAENQQNIVLQAEKNKEAGVAVEAAKQQAAAEAYNFQKDLLITEKQWDMEILKTKIAGDIQVKSMEGGIKTEHKHIEADAKVITKAMEVAGNHEDTKIKAKESQKVLS